MHLRISKDERKCKNKMLISNLNKFINYGRIKRKQEKYKRFTE